MRAFSPPAILRKIRWFWQMSRGVTIDPSVCLFSNVSLLRFPKGINLGPDVVIKSGAHLCPCRPEARISVGARTTIGFHSFLYASQLIEIGDDCMIAPFVYIVDSDHGTSRENRMNLQAHRTKPIKIGDDVWVGAHAVILAGTSIGNGAVVAAGAVVRGEVAPGSVVGGVPASFLRERK